MRRVVHLEAEYVPENMIVVGDPDRARYLAQELLEDTRIINRKRGYFIYEGRYKGKPVGIGVHYIGGPTIAIFLEEIKSLGASRIVRLGTCGSLCEDIRLGDIVIPPSSAHANEGGVIRQYHPHGYPPLFHSPRLVQLIHDSLAKNGLNPTLKPVVSSDAFYAEDKDFARYYCERNIACVEMECSVMAYIGLIRGIETSCVLIASDELLHPERGHMDSETLKDRFIDAAKGVLDVLVSLRVTSM